MRREETEKGKDSHLFSLQGKAAVVTGGASGLGRAIARGFADAGSYVAIADISGDQAEEVAREIDERGGQAIGLQLDVTQPTEVEAMAERVVRQKGGIDILVNSAGVTFRSPALEYPEGEWDRVLNVNLKGTFLCCQAVGKRMVAQGKGSIINIASIGGLIGYGGCIAYLASKGGVVQLTRGLAVEWAKAGVRVNAIAPFVFDTPMVSQIKVREPGHFQRMIDKAPMGRLGRAEELIGTAIFLASPASNLITGHILAVDGGFLAQ
jgi:NAD(P)-dependent dehydrogenase (short-subunit alcohol dehydrogenase family)